MTDEEKLAVTLKKRFAATPERVFDAWLDPNLVRYWFAPGLGDMARVEIDAREGGQFQLDQLRDEGLARHWGTYLKIDRPSHLLFTWCVDEAMAPDTVAIDIEPLETGCELTLTHWIDPAYSDYQPLTQRGWDRMLGGLHRGLAITSGHGEWVATDAVRFERLLPGSIERVWEWLVDPDKRAQWLAGGVLPSTPNQDFTLQFDHHSLSKQKVDAPRRYAQIENGVQTQHRVIRYQPPHTLGITWGGGNEGPSEVLFELSEVGDRVRLRLTHSRLSKTSMANVAGGWHTHLAILMDRLAELEPPSFWALFSNIENNYLQNIDGNN